MLDSDDRSTRVFVSDSASSDSEDRFVVAGTLGQGGFGVVVKAFDRTLRRYVAIKVPRSFDSDFDPDLFLLEARAASSLRHPNIVTVYDVGMRDGRPFIVSECIDGVTLRSWMEGTNSSFVAIAKLFGTLCRAIAYAHSAGIVHRDIKPSNVVVDDRDEPHVLDFGLSKSRSSGEAALLKSGIPFGTPAYMSPEQARGEAAFVGKHSDVYALGVVLYQMLTRRLPFVGSPRRILDLILNEAPVRPRSLDSRIPASLEAIALKAMQKRIELRYESADALADDIDRFMDGRPVAALGRHDARSFAMTARRGFIGTLAATATCGFVGAGLWIGWRTYQDDRRVRVRIEGGSSDQAVMWIPIDDYVGTEIVERIERTTADRSILLLPGLYRVLAEAPDGSSEVWRTVPEPGNSAPYMHFLRDGRMLRPKWLDWNTDPELTVPRIAYVAPSFDGFTRVEGADFSYSPKRREHALSGPHEVPTFYLADRTIAVGELLSEYGDSFGNDPTKPESEAIVNFEVALDYAERRGMRLMTASEWLCAATNRGRTLHPWGNEEPANVTADSLAPIDVCRDYPSVTGLYSGSREWTQSIVGYGDTRPGEALEKERLRRRWSVGAVPPVSTVPMANFGSTVELFQIREETPANRLAFRLARSASPPRILP